MTPSLDALAEDLRNEFSDDLRVVAEYDNENWHMVYSNDDIRESYTDEDLNRVFDDMILQGMGTDYLEDIFHAGSLHGSTLCFDEAIVLHFRTSEDTGIAISVDSSRPIELPDFVYHCKRMASKQIDSIEIQ